MLDINSNTLPQHPDANPATDPTEGSSTLTPDQTAALTIALIATLDKDLAELRKAFNTEESQNNASKTEEEYFQACFQRDKEDENGMEFWTNNDGNGNTSSTVIAFGKIINFSDNNGQKFTSVETLSQFLEGINCFESLSGLSQNSISQLIAVVEELKNELAQTLGTSKSSGGSLSASQVQGLLDTMLSVVTQTTQILAKTYSSQQTLNQEVSGATTYSSEQNAIEMKNKVDEYEDNLKEAHKLGILGKVLKVVLPILAVLGGLVGFGVITAVVMGLMSFLGALMDPSSGIGVAGKAINHAAHGNSKIMLAVSISFTAVMLAVSFGASSFAAAKDVVSETTEVATQDGLSQVGNVTKAVDASVADAADGSTQAAEKTPAEKLAAFQKARTVSLVADGVSTSVSTTNPFLYFAGSIHERYKDKKGVQIANMVFQILVAVAGVIASGKAMNGADLSIVSNKFASPNILQGLNMVQKILAAAEGVTNTASAAYGIESTNIQSTATSLQGVNEVLLGIQKLVDQGSELSAHAMQTIYQNLNNVLRASQYWARTGQTEANAMQA